MARGHGAGRRARGPRRRGARGRVSPCGHGRGCGCTRHRGLSGPANLRWSSGMTRPDGGEVSIVRPRCRGWMPPGGAAVQRLAFPRMFVSCSAVKPLRITSCNLHQGVAFKTPLRVITPADNILRASQEDAPAHTPAARGLHAGDAGTRRQRAIGARIPWPRRPRGVSRGRRGPRAAGGC